MIDLLAVERTIRSLHALISRDRELAAFKPAADELLRMAEGLARGERPSQAVIVPKPAPAIPSAKHAEQIVRLIGELPNIDADEDPALVRALGVLHAYLVDGIAQDVFARYPHLVPREPLAGS